MVQRPRIRRHQLSDLWHADRFAAERADLRWCPRLRSAGRLLRLLANRLSGNNLRTLDRIYQLGLWLAIFFAIFYRDWLDYIIVEDGRELTGIICTHSRQ